MSLSDFGGAKVVAMFAVNHNFNNLMLLKCVMNLHAIIRRKFAWKSNSKLLCLSIAYTILAYTHSICWIDNLFLCMCFILKGYFAFFGPIYWMSLLLLHCNTAVGKNVVIECTLIKKLKTNLLSTTPLSETIFPKT